MTDKELKRLSRQELLDELYSYAKANAELRLQVENKEEELKQQAKGYEEKLAREKWTIQSLSGKIKELEDKNRSLSQAVKSRQLELQEAGNIAEATLKMTGIFEEAQKTAEIYLANVKKLADQQEEKLRQMELKSRMEIQRFGDEASKTCLAMRKQAEKECNELRRKTETECHQLKEDAITQAEEYWAQLSVRLENFYKAHQGMKELFGSDGIRIPRFRDMD
ncbi:MAG: hypothetical protein Q4B85_05670 [Lachnospiraceae bacterium]|nr:hypothetical protein [Lachnospiraceae bacterium]